MKMKIMISLFLSLFLSACANNNIVIKTVETGSCEEDYEVPTLTAWAYNHRSYQHFLDVCKDADGKACSLDLIERAVDPQFNTCRLESLISQRESQKLLCGNSLKKENRYTIDDKEYNRILANMKKIIKNNEKSNFMKYCKK